MKIVGGIFVFVVFSVLHALIQQAHAGAIVYMGLWLLFFYVFKRVTGWDFGKKKEKVLTPTNVSLAGASRSVETVAVVPESVAFSAPLAGASVASAVMWKCPKCGEAFGDKVKKCWACGTERQDALHEPVAESAATIATKNQDVVNSKSEPKTVGKNPVGTVLKVLGWIGIILAMSIASVIGKGCSRFLINSASKTTIVPASLVWQQQQLSDISLTAPMKLREFDLAIPERARAMINNIKNYQAELGDAKVFVSVIEYAGGIQASLEGGAKGAINSMKAELESQGGSDFAFDQKNETRSGKDALLVSGTFKDTRKGVNGVYRAIMAVEGAKAWAVGAVFLENDANISSIVDRILDSVSIT